MVFKEYIVIIQYLIICFLLSSLSVFSTWVVYQRPDKEKGTAYECGFNPYGDARSKFEVRYYIVGLLFIIFDLEIIYIFPWVVEWWHLSKMGIYIMYAFVFLLTVGLIYEYNQGAVSLFFSTKFAMLYKFSLIIVLFVLLFNIYYFSLSFYV
jgi:NADH-quinone oxidoreductase subunit A